MGKSERVVIITYLGSEDVHGFKIHHYSYKVKIDDWRRWKFNTEEYNFASIRTRTWVVIVSSPKRLGYVDKDDCKRLFNKWREQNNYGAKWGEM